MAFSVTKRYVCPSCGYSGKNWVYLGVQDMMIAGMGKWHMANCPQCKTTRCIEEVKK